MKYLFPLILIAPLILKAQRVVNYDNDINYDWSNFDLIHFTIASVVCTGLIMLGFKLTKNYKYKIQNTIGVIMIITGGIVSFIYLLGPLIAIVKMLWLIIIGLVLFSVLAYFLFSSLKNKL